MGLARSAEHRDCVAAPHVVTVVGVRIVDNVAAGFPERFPGSDDSRRLAFQLEEHLAFEHVTESRA